MRSIPRCSPVLSHGLRLPGDAVVVNPEISSGLPLPALNRYPTPASRPEKYSTPATKGVLRLHALDKWPGSLFSVASDPAQNPYWKRDVRRAYPQLSVVTQSELSTLLIEHSAAKSYVLQQFLLQYNLRPHDSSVAAPSDSADKSGVPAVENKTLDLAAAIASITSKEQVYSDSRLPPALPTPNKRWVPKLSPPAPHEPHSYFPMSLYR